MKIDSPLAITELLVSGNAEISGSLSVEQNISAESLTGSVLATGDILPSVPDQFDIGSDTQRFRDIYLSGSTIFLGDVKLSESDGGELKVVDAEGNEIIVREVDTTLIDSRLDNLESESGSIRTDFNELSGSTVNLSGDQIITGTKTFSSSVILDSGIISSQSIDVSTFGEGDIKFITNNLEAIKITSSGSVIINNSSSFKLPTGDDDSRPTETDIGLLRFNTVSNFPEIYDGDNWVTLEPGGGATGSLGDKIFIENERVVNNSYNITSQKNAMSTGPIFISSSATVTLDLDSKWVVSPGSRGEEASRVRTILNNYTSSVADALTFDGINIIANNDVTVAGDLLVQRGILSGDVFGPSEFLGTLFWDKPIDRWFAGTSGSESRIILELDTTSLNEPDKIVVRDPMGNFSAGTISATLSGSINSTSATITGGSINGTSITGGSINGTSIGSSVTNTGAFTTLSASTSLTTPLITQAGTIALSATGANIITASTNGAERLRITSAGSVGIGTNSPSERLHVNGGNILCSGNVTAFSDGTLKENIEPISNAIQKIQSITGITYTRNDLDDKDKRHTGVIAQEVEMVLPEAVSTTEDGIKSVAYGNMVGLLIQAIKEQQTQIELLTTEINTLKNSI